MSYNFLMYATSPLLFLNNSPVQAQLQALQQELAWLQSQTKATTTTQNSQLSSAYAFTRSLSVGSQGTDVSALQQILINDGDLTAINSPSGYFGQATKKALIEYQNTNGITPAAGYCGQLTIASLEKTPPAGSTASENATPTTQSQPQTITEPPINQQQTTVIPPSSQQTPIQQPLASTTLCDGLTYTTACPAGEYFVCPSIGDAYCQASINTPVGGVNPASNPYLLATTTPACAAYQVKVAADTQAITQELSANGAFTDPSQILSLVLSRDGNPPSPTCIAPIVINGVDY